MQFFLFSYFPFPIHFELPLRGYIVGKTVLVKYGAFRSNEIITKYNRRNFYLQYTMRFAYTQAQASKTIIVVLLLGRPINTLRSPFAVRLINFSFIYVMKNKKLFFTWTRLKSIIWFGRNFEKFISLLNDLTISLQFTS